MNFKTKYDEDFYYQNFKDYHFENWQFTWIPKEYTVNWNTTPKPEPKQEEQVVRTFFEVEIPDREVMLNINLLHKIETFLRDLCARKGLTLVCFNPDFQTFSIRYRILKDTKPSPPSERKLSQSEVTIHNPIILPQLDFDMKGRVGSIDIKLIK